MRGVNRTDARRRRSLHQLAGRHLWIAAVCSCLGLLASACGTSSEPAASSQPSLGVTSTVPDIEWPDQPVAVPECGAYWGAYVNAPIRTGGQRAADRLRALEIVEDDLGRTFDIDHHFYRWDNFLSDATTKDHVSKSLGAGRIQFLSWKPVHEDGTNIAWSSIAAGDHDALIEEKAQRVAALNQPVLLVFGHEANGRVGPFEPGVSTASHIDSKAGSEQDFVDAWRHIHDVFARQQVDNVSWVWVMTRSPFEGEALQADLLFPGNEYVDWVGLDPYNFFHQQKSWTEMEQLMAGFTSWVNSREVEQPWLLGEWGTVEDPAEPGRKAQWLSNAADYFESEPRIKAIVHFDSSPQNNWLYDSSESAWESFIEVSNRPYFEQNC